MTTLASPQWLGLLTDIIALLGIPWAGYQIYKGRREANIERQAKAKESCRQNEDILIILKQEGSQRKICLPNKVRRGELTRAEVFGRIGMIPTVSSKGASNESQSRFSVKKSSTESFIRKIDELHVSSDKTELILDCSAREMEQFDITEIQKLGFTVTGFDQ